jgi:hypothetical protein
VFDKPIALFLEDEKGPLFQEFCADLEQARRKAQELANRQGLPVIIFSFVEARQVGRFKPKPKPVPALHRNGESQAV